MGMKRRPRRESIDEVVLAGLSHEYSSTTPQSTDEKIRRSLRYYGFDIDSGMQRIPELRSLKNRLLREFTTPETSNYYVRSPETLGFAALLDFDTQRLWHDVAKAHPLVDGDLLRGFIDYAVYLYYLR